MFEEIRKAAFAAAEEIIDKAGLTKGQILVVGCSTSEVCGERIGTASSPDVAQALFDGVYEAAKAKGIRLAAQCCEHLNRAIIVEREALPMAEAVNVIPQPKAGGSFATAAYKAFSSPMAVETIAADAGLDIGRTLIGMHLKRVAVPVRLENDRIGEALVIAARTRPRFIGGSRAMYFEA